MQNDEGWGAPAYFVFIFFGYFFPWSFLASQTLRLSFSHDEQQPRQQ